ncbi:hypothetical protein CSC33_0348 [Pseudomonas aeruginosa]|nr:hypothetical protein CSC33_0348 [Pseudomonas aeruginosa]
MAGRQAGGRKETDFQAKGGVFYFFVIRKSEFILFNVSRPWA